MKKIFMLLLAAAGTLAAADFDNSPFIKLWPEGKMPGPTTPAPEETKGAFQKGKEFQGFEVKNVSTPTLQFFKAESKKPTAAIIVCPGGAYRSHQYGHEGVDIARHLSEMGVSAFILKYRVPNEFNEKDRVFMDAQRAIRLVRQNAKQWNVDPDRIGVMGFSAGGHLAAWMSNNYDKEMYKPIDATDKQKLKPNFAVLVYPAWLNGLSRKPENKLVVDEAFPVTKDTPPTFIVHNIKDKAFYHASMAYFLELERNEVPVDFHMFYEGGHGHGMHKRKKPVDQWWSIFAEWLKFNKYAPAD